MARACCCCAAERRLEARPRGSEPVGGGGGRGGGGGGGGREGQSIVAEIGSCYSVRNMIEGEIPYRDPIDSVN